MFFVNRYANNNLWFWFGYIPSLYMISNDIELNNIIMLLRKHYKVVHLTFNSL